MDSETAEDIKRHFNVAAEGLRSDFNGLRSDFGDVKRHFNVVAEGLRSEIHLIAEGLGATNDRLDATNERVDGILFRMAEEFRDMRAMIRLLFNDHEGRIRALETGRS